MFERPVEFTPFVSFVPPPIVLPCAHARASEAGGMQPMQGIWHPNYLCGGDIDMYIPLEKPNT